MEVKQKMSKESRRRKKKSKGMRRKPTKSNGKGGLSKGVSNKAKNLKNSAKNSGLKAEQQLQAWYEEQHGIAFEDKCITLKSIVIEDKRRHMQKWKAHFTCPITKEVFLGGTLEGEEELVIDTIDGEVVYHKSKDARKGALARALDCFRYRQDEQAAKDMLCVETPYKFGEDPVVVVEELVVSEGDLDSEEVNEASGDVEEDVDDVDSVDEDESDDDSDEEEYTIQYLSGSSSNEHAVSNPLARVMGSWTNQTATLQDQPDALAPFITTHPEQELNKLLENAQDWIEKEQATKQQRSSDQHRVMLEASDFPRSLEIANSILDGLAKSHRRLSFQSKPRGVEPVATKILNHLWATRTAHPNASTYVAYMGCLEGQDPLSVANRAKDILDGMTEGKAVDAAGEKIMPKPTLEVVNAVIQLFAQVGGESGRSFGLGGIKEPVNRETFLLLLSSMSYPPSVDGETGGFDPTFAEFCLAAMKEAGFAIDITAYNAGLRWSGGLQSTLSRPYLRPIAWDSYSEIFQNGFQPVDEGSPTVQEAYRVHAWLEDMTSEGGTTVPNIETCEAVIQAYVRTGAREGVKQAEMLLESLLDATSKYAMPTPRLQTFHPIIAAWAASGDKEGPQNVNKWIDRLHGLSKGKDQTEEFESHVVEAPLLASSNYICESLKNMRNGSEVDATKVNSLVDTAFGCTIHLKDLCSSLQKGNGVESSPTVDSHVFALLTHVWGSLGLHFLHAENKSEEAKQALEKMYESVDLYEKLIASLHSTAPSQVHGLLANAHKIYSVFVSALQNAATASKANEFGWRVDEHIGSLEKWARRMGEFADFQMNTSERANDIIYGDMYSYVAGSASPEGCAQTQAEFLLQILGFLREHVQDPVASPRRGDMLRICFLIMEMLPSANKSSEAETFITDGKRPFSVVSGHAEVIKTACHLASGPEEREALLERILVQADWLMENQICSASDHDLIVKEIRKQSPSVQPRRPARTRMRRSQIHRARTEEQKMMHTR